MYARPNNRRITWTLDRDRLMAESEGVIAHLRLAGSGKQKRLVRRLTENRHRYDDWVTRHTELMSEAADEHTVPAQLRSLRKTLLEAVHVSALHRYLSRHRLSRADSFTLVRAFHAFGDLDDVLAREYEAWLRAESTSICVRYLAVKMGDSHLTDWLADYYRLYDEYFTLFCEAALADARNEAYAYRAVLVDLKKRVHSRREKLLDLAGVDPQVLSLRSPTGQYRRPRFRTH